jgi:DNA polymerase-1
MWRKKIPEFSIEMVLVEMASELPCWDTIGILYLDLETTSESEKLDSLNVWHHCKILGIAVTVDDDPTAYYVPLRHYGPNTFRNLPYEEVQRWLQDLLKKAKVWINHNIKYDAHVLLNEGYNLDGLELIDSMMLCKMAPKEERFTYNLTDIMNEWFFKNIQPYEDRLHLHLKRGAKDYGLVPIDIMAPYSAVDVLSVRHIWKNLMSVMPAECTEVIELEKQVTPVLLGIENTGMMLDMELVQAHAQALPATLFLIEKELARLTKIEGLRPHTNADCKDLIIGKYGLPVIEWTDKKQPSFGSDAILGYKAMRPDLGDVFDWLLKYKELHKLFTGFTTPYQDLNVNGIVHPDYNQIVRTGRMSCRTPNMQQLSPEAKDYIKPSGPDRVLVDIDFSQIEYRLIAHYTKAEHVIKEYAENPKADYHQIIADICGINRKEAKTINFCLSYGGGRGKVIEILSGIAEVIERCQGRNGIEVLGNNVYAKFHVAIPTLRPTTWQASKIMAQRGYVRTIMGRRRYLPRKVRFKSFNSCIQGSAADLFKAALVRVANELNPEIKLIGCVHDSFLFDAPRGMVESEVPKLVKIIEEIPRSVKLRVPITAKAKSSDKNWRQCG